MAKKKTRSVKKSSPRQNSIVDYNSPMFLLLLAFVLLVSLLLVSGMMGFKFY